MRKLQNGALWARSEYCFADDHEAVLARVRVVLGEEFEIVGWVMNGNDAVREVQRLDPDVLVIDISMPGLNGLQAASRLQSRYTRTKVVFLTVHEDRDFVDAAFSAGASAYVTKSQVTTDLIPGSLRNDQLRDGRLSFKGEPVRLTVLN